MPASVVREDDQTIAFQDADPQAPVHLLIIPKQHITDVAELGRNPAQAAGVLAAVAAVVEQLGISDFRTVFNTGADGGQARLPRAWPPACRASNDVATGVIITALTWVPARGARPASCR